MIMMMVMRVIALIQILSQSTCLLRLVQQWCHCHWRATGPAHLKASNSSDSKDAEEDSMVSLLDSVQSVLAVACEADQL